MVETLYIYDRNRNLTDILESDPRIAWREARFLARSYAGENCRGYWAKFGNRVSYICGMFLVTNRPL